MNQIPEFDARRLEAVRRILVENARQDPVPKRKAVRKSLLIGVVSAGALTVGAGALAAGGLGWIAQPCPSAAQCRQPSYGTVPAWPRNERGEAYGSQGYSPVPPDLIAVVATNGEKGYVFAKELAGRQPTNPAEAARDFASPPPPREIPVYLSDGTTRIGTFVVGSR